MGKLTGWPNAVLCFWSLVSFEFKCILGRTRVASLEKINSMLAACRIVKWINGWVKGTKKGGEREGWRNGGGVRDQGERVVKAIPSAVSSC